MKSLYAYIVSPKDNKRYKNEIKLNNGKSFVVNTDIFNHQYISREAVVLCVPEYIDTPVKVGDTVIVHHNIFRRWNDQRGIERNSHDYIREDQYLCHEDQVFMYKSNGTWKGLHEYCFVSPIKNNNSLLNEKEVNQLGVVEVPNNRLIEMGVNKGDVVRFLPNREYEFIVEGKRMYRMRDIDIFQKESDMSVEIYNPDWVSCF